MKNIQLLAMALIASILVSAGFSGCAGVGSGNTKDLLSASGFKIRVPETDKQKEIYAKLKSYKMETGIVNGTRLYGYKDEKKGVVYVGNETDYQAYMRLLNEQNIATTNMMAAQMNSMTIQRYSAFGPTVYLR